MPNWCEGVLRIRGKQKDIIKMISEQCYLYNYKEQTQEFVPYINDTKYMAIPDERFIDTELWLKDCHRMAVELSWDFEYLDLYDMEEVITLACNCRQAWGISSEDLQNLSLLYNVDFRIYAFERGAEFNQDVEVIGGVVKKDDTIKFQNYTWDCINCMIGG